jgi:predicted dehydrogenase
VLSGYGFSAQFHDGTAETFEPPAASMGGGADPMDFPHDLHLAVWTDFLDAIANGRAPRITAAEALKVHHLVDAMLAAGKTDSKVKVSQ